LLSLDQVCKLGGMSSGRQGQAYPVPGHTQVFGDAAL